MPWNNISKDLIPRIRTSVVLGGFLIASTALIAQAGRPEFAFWYEPWNNGASFDKLGKPQTIIGLSPSDVPNVHKLGARALRYVTFYQSRYQPFLKDEADLPNVGFWDGHAFLLSAFGGKGNYVLCDNSKVMHDRVMAYTHQTLADQRFDGFFIDNTYVSPAAQESCKSTSHPHVMPGARGDDAFLELLSEFRAEVKKTAPSAIIVTNPGNPTLANKLGTGKFNLWDLSDYVTWESYGYTSYRDQRHNDWKHTLESSFALPETQRRKVIALSFPMNSTEAFYSFAVANIFGLKWTANLGENAVETTATGGHFGVFMNDLPYDIGSAVGEIQGNATSDRISRKFAHGEAVANISNAPIKVRVPAGMELYQASGVVKTTKTSDVIVQPNTAIILTP